MRSTHRGLTACTGNLALTHTRARGPWANYLTSPRLIFCICKMGIITVSASWCVTGIKWVSRYKCLQEHCCVSWVNTLTFTYKVQTKCGTRRWVTGVKGAGPVRGSFRNELKLELVLKDKQKSERWRREVGKLHTRNSTWKRQEWNHTGFCLSPLSITALQWLGTVPILQLRLSVATFPWHCWLSDGVRAGILVF